MKTLFLFLPALLPLLAAAQYDCASGRFASEVFASVTQTDDVQYGQNKAILGANTPLLMDVFEPAGDTLARRPLVIWATGGYFLFCDKTEMHPACISAAKRGFVSASITYRLWGQFSVPDSVKYMSVAIRATHDMKAAIRFFKADAAGADLYRVDTTRIFVGGYSAGAIMSLQAAFVDRLTEVPAFIADTLAAHGGIEGDSGNPGHISSDIVGVISMAGALYRDTIMDAGNNIPTLLVHGDADEVIPYGTGYANAFGVNIVRLDGSLPMHNRLTALGIPNTLFTVPGGGHDGPISTLGGINWNDSTTQYVNNFLASQMCGWTMSAPAPVQAVTFALVPNPANGAFRVQASGCDAARATLRLYNCAGQEVLIMNGIDGQLHPVSLPAGLYQAVLTTADGQQLRQKWAVE